MPVTVLGEGQLTDYSSTIDEISAAYAAYVNSYTLSNDCSECVSVSYSPPQEYPYRPIDGVPIVIIDDDHWELKFDELDKEDLHKCLDEIKKILDKNKISIYGGETE